MVKKRLNTPEQFAYQLREGHFNELRVALYFMLQGDHVRLGYNGQAYDLSVIDTTGRRFTVEVKWDKRAGETGNLYFEVQNTRRRMASGIAVTRADYWCHVIGEHGEEAFLAPVSSLRAFLHRGRFQHISTGGVDSNSLGILVPRERLQRVVWGRWITLPTVEAFFGLLFREGTASGRIQE